MQYTRNNFSLHDFSSVAIAFLLTWRLRGMHTWCLLLLLSPFSFRCFVIYIFFFSSFVSSLVFFFSLPLVLIFLFASIRSRSALLANGKKRFSVVEEEKRRITSKVREKNAEIYVRFLFSFTFFDVSESYTHTHSHTIHWKFELTTLRVCFCWRRRAIAKWHLSRMNCASVNESNRER